MADLEALVDARLVVEIRELGQPSRYGLSRSGRNLASRSDPDGHVYPIEDWPEPCPACLAREGLMGRSVNRCHIAWPPEMRRSFDGVTVKDMFDGPELRAVLELTANKAIKEEASELTDAHAVSLPVDELTDEIIATHDLEVPTLHSAARYFEEGGSRTGIELHTPFDGTAGLFHNRPSRFSLGGGLDGQIVASEVVVTLGQAAGADERADVSTEQVSNYLGYVAHDVDVWRPGLRQDPEAGSPDAGPRPRSTRRTCAAWGSRSGAGATPRRYSESRRS